MSSVLKELWEKLKGKGPAAGVSITVDLGTARENQPYNVESGGLIVETCTGDLYARLNGPNGDGFNLRYVRRILYPLSSLYLTNTAQPGKAARLVVLPQGLDASAELTTDASVYITETGTLQPFSVTSTGDVKTPDTGKALRILSFFYYSQTDVVTELRFKTSGNIIAGLPAKGAVGMNLLGQQKPQGAAEEVVEIYLGAAGVVKGWINYVQV